MNGETLPSTMEILEAQHNRHLKGYRAVEASRPKGALLIDRWMQSVRLAATEAWCRLGLSGGHHGRGESSP